MPDPDEETVFLAAMAKRYVWNQSVEQALAYPDRIVFRVMDLGTIDDVLRLEPVLGRDRLSTLLRAAPAGALRPRSWWFWHYRTRLTPAEHDPPAMPVRTYAWLATASCPKHNARCYRRWRL